MGFIVITILVSLLCSAFFSGMEMAFVTSNRFKIEVDSKKGDFFSKVLSSFAKKPDEFIVTMLIGNNISLVFYGIYMGNLIVELLFPQYIGVSALPPWVLLIQTCISTILILVTAEFLPKVIFKIYANELLKFFIIPAYIFYKTFSILKVTFIITWGSNFILKTFFKIPLKKNEQVFKMVDFGNYITESIGDIPENKLDIEFQILKNAVNFHEKRVRDKMIPRTEIRAIDFNASVEELKDLFVETAYSRLPVFKGDVDNTVGYVHSFELFKNPKTIRNILLPIEMIPETMFVKDLLDKFIQKRTSIAIVLDEYGGTSGLITMEDIVEQLFGDIEDEHDREDLINLQKTENSFHFSGKLEVEQINKSYQLGLPESEDYSTIAGLIVHYNKNIPNKGDIIIIEKKYKFKILEVTDTKIDEIEFSVE